MAMHNAKILWYFSVQANRKLEHNKPDNLIVDKQTGECHITDVACSFVTQVKEKDQEKVQQFYKLKREIWKLWQYKKVVVLSIIIGALGTIGKNFRTWIRKIQMENYCYLMQKACLIGTAKII